MLIGRLGKRTRFQEKELAQLTASIKCESLDGLLPRDRSMSIIIAVTFISDCT